MLRGKKGSDGRIYEDVPISAGARQHLVDTEDVEGVYADSQVEGVFARCLGNILVGADTCSLKSLARKLLILVGYKMATVRELVDGGTLAAEIKDTNLGTRGENLEGLRWK